MSNFKWYYFRLSNGKLYNLDGKPGEGPFKFSPAYPDPPIFDNEMEADTWLRKNDFRGTLQ